MKVAWSSCLLLLGGLWLLAPSAFAAPAADDSRQQAREHIIELQHKADKYDVLPPPVAPAFTGRIGLRANESTPSWPAPLSPPKAAPNVLLILLDDVGFGATSTFGGPIPTPTFDAIAAKGLRYTHFHTTALCSPTRAALLTGRNHHSVHSGTITEGATGYPGYDSLITKDTASIGEILKLSGYNTMWTGKMHNVPDWMSSQSGPFDLWPTGLGFEHFYGFIGGDTSQWRPAMYKGTEPVEPYEGKPDYILNNDLANYTINYIEKHVATSPDKPWLVYYAPGATHAPHHAPPEWIAKFKGEFDHGWDEQRQRTLEKQKEMGIFPEDAVLSERPAEIPAWDNCTMDRREVFSRMMEVYAGFLAHTDYEIGRVMDRIKELDQEDNTLVFLMIGDNGASGEGSLNGLLNMVTFRNAIPESFEAIKENIDLLGTDKSYNHYPVGWAHAMNAPFQWTKQVASHYGGTRNPLVISWPAEIKKEDQGGMRTQWHHIIDVVPTILEAAGIDPPSLVNGVAQKRHEGVSMMYSFHNQTAPSKRETQYFEMLGNQGIYSKGWTAGTHPTVLPWVGAGGGDVDPLGMTWELYHVEEDPTQSKNLAEEMPEKLKEMKTTFFMEASMYQVFPLDNSKIARALAPRPSLLKGRKKITYFDGMVRNPEGSSPDMKNKDFNITAKVTLATDKESGVLATIGGRFGGWVLMMRNGTLVFHYNYAGIKRFEIESQETVGKGDHTLCYQFDYNGGGLGKGGEGTLLVDGKEVGKGEITNTIGFRFAFDETFDIGADTGTPAAEDYDVPNKFTGTLKSLVVEV